MAEFIPSNQKLDTTCPVCLDTFKRPRSLPCLHTFCSECLQSHIINTSQSNLLSAFFCPVCRAQTKPPRPYSQRDTWAEQFPINHWIVCFMEETEKDHARDKNILCFSHPEFTVRLFCIDHDSVCCPMCIATEHRKCDNVKELKDVAETIDIEAENRQLQSALTSSMMIIDGFRGSRHEQVDIFVTSRENIIQDIRVKKEAIIQHLNTIEDTILHNIEQTTEATLHEFEKDIEWCNTAEGIIKDCQKTIV